MNQFVFIQWTENQQTEHLFELAYNVLSTIAFKVNLENNIKHDLVKIVINPVVQASNGNLCIMQFYEVGLLCDME